MILDHWFPSADGYMIHPQWPIPNSHRTIDFAITFQSNMPGWHHSHVLLLVEISHHGTTIRMHSARLLLAKSFTALMRLGQPTTMCPACMLFLGKGGGHIMPSGAEAAGMVGL